MELEKAIVVNNVSKKYKLYSSMKERILDLISPKSYGKDFYALSNVSFSVDRGDVVGFIGINGSGKSTLSNIVAGIVPETSGTVKTNGTASLIAVNSGLKGDLTGRDNIELKCLMLGFSKEEIMAMEPDIIEFSELGEFIDQPVKSYSSGMKSRLGFAISVNVDPDILIIDEALSVGDKAFAEKSFNKMMEFKEMGKTMIFVSHSISQMKKFCEKILWLEFGKVKDFGTTAEVLPKYEAFLKMWQNMTKAEREKYRTLATYSDNKKLTEFMHSVQKKHAEEAYTEQLVSLLAHIKGGKSYIYATPTDLSKKESSDNYKNRSYFIKKKVTYKGESFYLLSTEPSAQRGVIGWMKKKDIKRRKHTIIDHDPKRFVVKGTDGVGYDRPWGGKKNRIFSNLNQYKGYEFKVNRTDKVGKGIWYRGTIAGETIWVHRRHLR